MKICRIAANGFFFRAGSLLALAILFLGAGHSLAQKASDEGCKRSFAYVGNEFSDSVSVIDTRNNSVVTNIKVPETAVGPVGVAITPDGKRAYVAILESGTVVVIDTERMKAIKSINVGAAPSFLAVTPNGRRVYVTNQGSEDVSVIDTETNKIVRCRSRRPICLRDSGFRDHVCNLSDRHLHPPGGGHD
jgi:YVTN family beta-propeller protein